VHGEVAAATVAPVEQKKAAAATGADKK